MKYILSIFLYLMILGIFAQSVNTKCQTIFISENGTDSLLQDANFSGELINLTTHLDSLFSHVDTLTPQLESNWRYKIICSTSKLEERSAHGSFEYMSLGGIDSFCITDSTKGNYVAIPAPSHRQIVSEGFMTPLIICDTLVRSVNQGIFLKIEYSYSSSFCDDAMAIPWCKSETWTTTIYCIREDEFENFIKK